MSCGSATSRFRATSGCSPSALRYLLLRTHAWNDEVVERLRQEFERDGL